MIIATGKISESLNVGKLIPIIKDSTLEATIENTRLITISDTITNIYEKVIFDRILKSHRVNDLQFGFKTRSSCNHAVYILMEISREINQKGERCYAVAIDASKAFDKVNRNKLLAKLSNVALNFDITTELLRRYKNDNRKQR